MITQMQDTVYILQVFRMARLGCGFEGSRGSTRVCHQQLSIALNPNPFMKKFSLDFYVLRGPYWAAQRE